VAFLIFSQNFCGMANGNDSPLKKTWIRLLKNKPAIISLAVIVVAMALAIIGPSIAPDKTPDADDQVLELANVNPGFQVKMLLVQKNREEKPSSFFSRVLFGRDNPNQMIPIVSYRFDDSAHIVLQTYEGEGRTERKMVLPVVDVTQRVSLSVGLIAVLISLTIGIFMGSVAGFYKGTVDNIIMWFINVIWSIPTILLAMAIRFAIGDKIPSFLAIFIAVGLSMWVEVARLVRGQVLSVREMEYVQAARSLGFNNTRIIIKHILPNIIGPIMVIAASDFASAILIEAGLSFVGIGVKPPTPSWGTMLNDHRQYINSFRKSIFSIGARNLYYGYGIGFQPFRKWFKRCIRCERKNRLN
jgi:ABC-type dipeptide/oligopeptide/nickel transport system permease subunit